MKHITRTVALAALVAVALPVTFAVAQLFGNFPQVGGPAYDAGSGVMVPAGPSALTGLETVPADTNLSQGRQPQTVKVPVSLLSAGPTRVVTPLTGNSITIAPTDRRLYVTPAGTLAALTLVFPPVASIANGQQFQFCSTQILTALTITASGATFAPTAPTTFASANLCAEWVFNKPTNTWLRTQTS